MTSSDKTPPRKLVYESLTTQVMESIRREISEQVLVPGELYSGYQIAERLSVSRSPVRDALLRLAEEGTVEMVRNRGFYVVRPYPQDIVEIFALRLTIEVSAAARAAAQASDDARQRLRGLFDELRDLADADDVVRFEAKDAELHQAILDVDGNSRQVKVIRRLREETSTLDARTYDRDRSLGEIYDEHAPIVESILAADSPRAEEAMRSHLLSTGLTILDRVEAETGQSVKRVKQSGSAAVPPSWL